MKRIISGISLFVGVGLALIAEFDKSKIETAVTVVTIVFFMMIIPVALMKKH